jgi:hypothetical protein
MEELQQLVLDRLDVPVVESAEGREFVATVFGPKQLDDLAREEVAAALARRLREGIDMVAANGAPPIALVQFDHSDDANCEDVLGTPVNAFIAGGRCYRAVVRLA